MIIFRVLVTGSKGQLGMDIVTLLSPYHEVIGKDKRALDITNMNLIEYYLKTLNPQVIINCAGYTNVDGCEKNVSLAYRVNTIGVKNLAIAANAINAILVHISTDYIFDGSKKKPYIESDKPNPLNIYGTSKWIAEQFIKKKCKRYYIIRTSWLYGPYGDNFVTKIIREANSKNTIKVVDDQIGSPTYTKDLVKTISKLVKLKKYGTYHITNAGECSRYEFTNKIIEYTKKNIIVLPISTEQLHIQANRPKYSVLDNHKIESILNYNLPSWELSLKDFLNHIRFNQNHKDENKYNI